MSDIMALDRRDPCLERRARGKARLERLPYVDRVDAAKRIRLKIAEIDAQGRRSRPTRRALVKRLAVDERAVDVPGDRAKEAHDASELRPLGQPAIEVAIAAIAAAIDIGGFRSRLDPIGGAHKGGDRRPVGRETHADRGRPGGADARAGMAGEPLNRALEDVGDDLHPYRARRTAVGDDEALGLVADLVHDLDMMRDRISVGLEQGAPEVADVVREREAIKGRARVGVVDRRLFAEKIGRDDEPLAAGGPRLGEPVEPLMDREARLIRRLLFAACELARRTS